jgi:hypothetical protein
MKKLIYSILIAKLLIACDYHHIKNLPSNPDYTITFNSKLIDSIGGVDYFQCDDYSAFKISPNTKSIDNTFHGYFNFTKEPIINMQDSTIVDTIYKYVNHDNKIEIYKSYYSGDLLMLYDVVDSIFEINGNIKPGISKDYFQKKFNIKGAIEDIVDIGNLEQTNVVRFYFKYNKLIRIRTEPYID